jgi:hypothetical protein
MARQENLNQIGEKNRVLASPAAQRHSHDRVALIGIPLGCPLVEALCCWFFTHDHLIEARCSYHGAVNVL